MQRINGPLLALTALFGVAAFYCTQGVMVRTDDAGELASKRVDAVLLTLLWPLAFALLGLALRLEWKRVAVWTVLILFLSWIVGAGSMQKEYSRGGDYWGVLGY